ncbi:unnamed protein product [Adineta steineri]|uniref:Uncharacterized protein n=1 Tax=Adineta steineri TaxID=433720 RepID=A0A814H7E5_9BILA|nr:unnamed protein product [Adineta steineri]
MEDSSKSMAQRITATQFGYDGCWIEFRNNLKKFKDNCKDVYVVFDGFRKSNDHRRTDPDRHSSVRFDDNNDNRPSLIREELMNILHQLQIMVYVVPSEADPMIVRMARERQAYIVARDVDYHLYKLDQGYVPLPHLKFDTLEGRLYHMADVFQGFTEKSVALWATIIAFDFVNFDVLEEFFSLITATAKDKKSFRKWLDGTDSDDEKRQWLTCQWNLRRYIPQVGEIEAFEKLTELVPIQHRPLFNQLIDSYITVPDQTLIRTRNNNELPLHLHKLYTVGKLDRAVIDILVTGEVLPRWQGTHLSHLRLLLPMCHILLQWDYHKDKAVDPNPTVTFRGQQYRPFELVQRENLPLLDGLVHREKKRQKAFVLGCVDFALQHQSSINWHGVQNSYLPWLSLLKLWSHSRETTMLLREPILWAMIISYLKHEMLDTYDETEGKYPH